MTTRDEARRRTGNERPGPEAGSAIPAEPPNGLGERLQAARERKGVDLYRAERDTKIRARYLGALERGDYRELPGDVYVKGFLRNYALYLGLDPEEVLGAWRRERGSGAAAREPSITVPRPLTAPRRGFTFSVGIFVAAVLTVAVVLFVGYIGFQVLRYNRPPEIAVVDPQTAVVTVDEGASEYILRGTSAPGATVKVSVGGATQPTTATAATDGTWSVQVPLRRGRNEFTITATDPETGKSADPLPIVIEVPLPTAIVPTLSLTQPADGATFQDGSIQVQGTATNARSVTVVAAPVTATPSASPKSTPTPQPSASPAAPAGQTVDVGTDGAFNVPLELAAGQWSVTVTATSVDGKTIAVSRSVTVSYKGMTLVVSINGGPAWMKVWVDGQLDPRVGPGKLFKDGRTITFTGTSSVEVFTGSSGVTFFTLNGKNLGHLGGAGAPETWLFKPTGKPRQTNHR